MLQPTFAILSCLIGIAACASDGVAETGKRDRPNVILVMADDLGWGDTGFNGHPDLKTPHLDRLADRGIVFERFYAAAPVCSPTRASCLTGRHPYRMGITGANQGHLKASEITLAEVLSANGYATGHFGKWHLGTLTRTRLDGRRGGRSKHHQHYAPPWNHSFDECFSAEVQMPTWNPMENQRFESRYWTGPDAFATDNLEGDDSRVIADRAVEFIKRSVSQQKAFLAVVWFHTPHSPVVAGPAFRKMYDQYDENHQHYYGAVTAMDAQVGRIWESLVSSGQADNTMLWFCSDNGPARQNSPRHVGSAGPFRGFKTSLYEGGVRVPALLVWPNRYPQAARIETACSTSDYFPTCLAAAGLADEIPATIDGINLLEVLDGKQRSRREPIAFESGKQIALIDNRYKIISVDRGVQWEMYDLIDDPGESRNVADENSRLLDSMVRSVQQWRQSCKRSNADSDE